MGPHIVGPQRPLERHTVGCHTMWPEAPRAGRSSQIQNLQRAKHHWGGQRKISCLNCKSHSNICWKHGAALRWGPVLLENVKEVMHLVSFYSLVAAVTEVERKKMSRTTWGLQVLHNALCDPHICTLRKWVIEWGNLPWSWTWDLCAVIGCLQIK